MIVNLTGGELLLELRLGERTVAARAAAAVTVSFDCSGHATCEANRGPKDIRQSCRLPERARFSRRAQTRHHRSDPRDAAAPARHGLMACEVRDRGAHPEGAVARLGGVREGRGAGRLRRSGATAACLAACVRFVLGHHCLLTFNIAPDGR